MYIGLVKSGITNNFILFKPRKGSINAEIRLNKSDDIDKLIEESGADVLEYNRRSGRYKIK